MIESSRSIMALTGHVRSPDYQPFTISVIRGMIMKIVLIDWLCYGYTLNCYLTKSEIFVCLECKINGRKSMPTFQRDIFSCDMNGN